METLERGRSRFNLVSPLAGYGCRDPSGMVAPLSSLASSFSLATSIFASHYSCTLLETDGPTASLQPDSKATKS